MQRDDNLRPEGDFHKRPDAKWAPGERANVVKRDENAEQFEEDTESREILTKVRKQNRNHIRQKLTIIPNHTKIKNRVAIAESMPYPLTSTHQAQSNCILKVHDEMNLTESSIPSQSH